MFSALGFYPVAPGAGEYAIGSPLFQKADITLENGNHIVVSASGNTSDTPYVGRMRFNGKEYDKNYLRHSDLVKGGLIEFFMQPQSNLLRGTLPQDAPYSFSRESRR